MKTLITTAMCTAIMSLSLATSSAIAQNQTDIRTAGGANDQAIVHDLGTEMGLLAAEDRFSGAVLLSKNGKPLFEHAYGLADRAHQAPNNVDTKFNMASVTKVFTAVAILQLVEQGKLSLNETLAEALPDYPNAEAARKITIHELLDHQSGLGDFFGEEYISNPANYRTLHDYLPLFASKPLLFEPGTKTAYSNAGFIVLGLIIERLSGVSYYDYVRDHIFKPTHMNDTGFWSSRDHVPNVASGYTRFASGGGPQSSNARSVSVLNATRGVSAGGSYSTVGDLTRFSEGLRTHKLLKADSFELMLSGGYGLLARSINNVRFVGHGGGAPGANSYFEMYPDQGYAVVILSNYDPPAAEMVAQRIRQQIVGAELHKSIRLSTAMLDQFAGKYAAVTMAVPNAQGTGPNMTMGPGGTPSNKGTGGLVLIGPGGAPPAGGSGGLVLIGPGGKPIGDQPIEISVDHDALRVTLGSGDVHEFVPLSTTDFFDRDTLSAARLTFTLDQWGRVTGLTIKGSGPIESIRAMKLP
jgi:CubicO group peptidase (beta-lactamase class C family)